MKKQIEELIHKGKLQKFVKKGDPSKSRDDNKGQHEVPQRDEDRIPICSQSAIKEIKIITRGPFTWRLFKALKKLYQRQVNSIHGMPSLKQRRTGHDMLFLEEDARGVKQPHDDSLVIMRAK